ncbi:NAD-dependent protein deacetylase [Anaerohalosphaera lusitana]|uniref:protein acetyllysine N-acetyltransferase n=1 Tax=Anaerohalosphaera lusitana TaxID=1936003 RepID=A0A1U9NK40_9BACT|nr:NAD-dependent protein deacylase [Anaerohalosphaera lusitana]AQT68292.1 NAD-dependent protein deacetylase [Anaerohalosphaera lusitana]
MDNAIEDARQLLDLLKKANRTVVLTGAGVSTASGIPDFRGPSGLYATVSQRVFEVDFLLSSPEEYYKIAYEYIHPLVDKEPNIAHRALAELEKAGLISAIITQNIDGLHQKAGSQDVIEFHGNVTTFRCVDCSRAFNRTRVDEMIVTDGVPMCQCGGLIRPDLVFFGDLIPEDAISRSQELATTCDVLLIMGTSLAVYPAASIPVLADQSGAKIVIVNKGPTELDHIADYRYEVGLEAFSQALMELIQPK